MRCRGEHHVPHLECVHLIVSLHENGQSAGDVRRGHRGTGEEGVGGVPVVIGDRAVNRAARRGNRPPLGFACFVQGAVKRVAPVIRLLHRGDRDPVLFRFRVEVGVERAVERIREVAVTRREHLHDLLILHGFVRRVNKRPPVPVGVGIHAILRVLLEEEILVLRF